MTRLNHHKHGDSRHGYASCRDQRQASSSSRRVRPRPRQISGRGGIPGPAARHRAPQRRPAAREPRPQRTSASERRSHPNLGPRDYSTVVLDAWPLLRAYGGEEPARSALHELLHDDSRTAVMNTVNLSEALGALLQQFGPEAADSQERSLRELVEIEPSSADVAVCAGRVHLGWYVSQADSMAVATALQHEAPLWTGDAELLNYDRSWLAVDLRDPARRDLQEHNRSPRALIGRKRRPTDRLAALSDDELAAYVIEPLHHDLEQRPPAPDLSLDLL